MGVKVKVCEGPDSTFEADLQTAINGLTVLAGTTPGIAVFGTGSRIRAVIVYRES
jgi:hypothetical protein